MAIFSKFFIFYEKFFSKIKIRCDFQLPQKGANKGQIKNTIQKGE